MADQKQQETVVHPFIRAMAGMGAQIGQQMGILALKSIEAQRGGVGAVLWWAEANMPDSVRQQLPHGVKVASAFILPAGIDAPMWLSTQGEQDDRLIQLNLVDGSRLVAVKA